jgi:hypothetical protein
MAKNQNSEVLRMDDREWTSMTDPGGMLPILRATTRPSNRKLRLFAVACYRCAWSHLLDAHDQAAAEVAERHADGEATDKELLEAYVDRYLADCPDAEDPAAEAEAYLQDVYSDALTKAGYKEHLWPGGAPILADLLRDIFGNPFAARPLIDKSWPTWNGGILLQLAQAAYDERVLPSGHLDASCLAVLADALEEAGVVDVEVLEHLRSPGPHVRGCWAVDLVLDKG